jgi:large repetitive protein
VLDAVVTRGGLALPAGTQPDDGSAARPFKLLPEFVLTTSTRAASTEVNGQAVGGAAGLPLGAGPMKVARIESEHTVGIFDAGGHPRTADLSITPVLGSVPAAVWEMHAGTDPPAEAKVRPAAVGATVVAEARTVGAAVPLPVDDVDPPGPRHPLPFHQEQATRPQLDEVREEADQFGAEQPSDTAEILRTASGYLATGVFQPTALSTLERRVFAADRVGPPRLAPLTEGIVDPVKPPAEVSDRPPPDPEPDPDTTVFPPVLDTQLRLLPPGTSTAAAATTVAPDRYGGRPVRRRVPPTLAEVRSLVARTPVAARLLVGPPPAARGATPAAASPTVVAAGATPRTLVAGGLAERRRGLLASQADVEALADLTRRLPDGVPLRPADIQVWRLPNSAADVASDRQRPSLTVEGDQLARVVALDSAGEVLLDRTGGELSVEVPLGAHRLVVAGLGAAGDATASGLAGWHAATTVAQVTPDVYLAPACLIRAEASRTVRARRTVGAALVRAGEAVAGTGTVATRLPGGLTAVLLALDTEGAVDTSLDGLVLGLEGADRAGAPLVVTAGDRVYAVFPLDPTARRSDSIAVTVGSDDRWLLSGVAGSIGPARDLADRVVAGGLADRVAELVDGALGSSVVRWSGI